MAGPQLVAHEDRWFVVEQCRDCALPGYLIVRPKIPVGDWNSVPVEALADLGPLLQRVVGAVQRLLHPVRVYVAQFGDQTADFHFHVFPRTAALTREFLQEFPQQRDLIHGPVLLDWARARYRDAPATEETFRALTALRQDLEKRPVRPGAASDSRRRTDQDAGGA